MSRFRQPSGKPRSQVGAGCLLPGAIMPGTGQSLVAWGSGGVIIMRRLGVAAACPAAHRLVVLLPLDDGRYVRDPSYDPASRRPISTSQPSPTGMIIHAAMAAARRREGDLRPTRRATTLAPARTHCPITAG